MSYIPTPEQALELVKRYNKEHFHVQHAETVGKVMGEIAKTYDPGNEDYWRAVGILHDIDYEQWPEEHCVKAQSLLAELDIEESVIHAVCSHGYGLVCDVEPTHEMEKALFACDELTGLIGAAAKMRPSKSVSDMEVSSLKKKFKDKKFAAGCSRDVIKTGAERMGVSLEDLIEKTILAMRSCEDSVRRETEELAALTEALPPAKAASDSGE